MSEFRLPDLGEGLEEAELVSWHVALGDHVVADQPLLTVETDKALVDIPCPESGHIVELHAKAGDVIRTGDLLVVIGDRSQADGGTVVGTIASDAASRQPAPATERHAAAPADRLRNASPAVRAQARAMGIALEEVVATGSHGEVTLDDVKRAAQAPSKANGDRVRGPRRAMFNRMTQAGETVVPATLHDTALLGDKAMTAPLIVRFVQAVLAGCREEPTLNASLVGSQQRFALNTNVHIAIAMDTADGLFAPVLRGAEQLSADQIKERVDQLRRAVLERTIGTEDLRGATITLSNFGAIAGTHASLVVTPPQVAILGVGRAFETPVYDGDTLVRTRALPLSLTFDHRVITGGEAARFLLAAKNSLLTPMLHETAPNN